MKKTLIIAAALILGAVVSQAQGLVSISVGGTYFASTNNGTVSGKAIGSGTAGYYYELLTAASTTIPASDNQLLTAANTASAAYSVWTDTGVSGVSGATGLHAGWITAGSSVAATGWAGPGATENDPQNYIIIGWSGNYGTTYAQFLTSLNGGLTAGGYFGSTAVSINDAGGGTGAFPAVNLWGNQLATPGYGIATGLVMNQVVAVPEPGTIAMAALGGLSLLAFRRKK